MSRLTKQLREAMLDAILSHAFDAKQQAAKRAKIAAKNFMAAIEHCRDLKAQREQMSREITPILESVHTFKKLWEVWLESKTLLDKFEVKPAIAILPAVQVNKLNVALGLPVSEVEVSE